MIHFLDIAQRTVRIAELIDAVNAKHFGHLDIEICQRHALIIYKATCVELSTRGARHQDWQVCVRVPIAVCVPASNYDHGIVKH